MVDTLAIARTRHPGAKHSLDALCTRFGVDRSLRVKHGALIDAQLLAQCYVELTGGRQIGLGLADIVAEPIEQEMVTVTLVEQVDVAIRAPRPHAPTEEELAAHASFLATISDPIWTRVYAPD
jgi:DNA polymerase-3 subunit epsilon